MPFVVDASAVLAVAYAEIPKQRSDALLDRIARDGAVVPAIFPVELANSLESGRRRNRLNAATIDAFLAILARLPIAVRHALTLDEAATLRTAAQNHALTAYDASYLVLALDESLDLVTLDAALERAARGAGIAVSGP